MYKKNLSEDLRLRLSKTDMDFLKRISEERNISVSECIRSIIGEYRRSLDMMNIMSETLKMVKEKGDMLSNGDTKTDFNDKL
jgi:hypothetical protein